jgi:hypothetical protein
MFRFCGRDPDPVADKSVEHFAQQGEPGCEPTSDRLFLVPGIKDYLGHRGLLANPTDMICR